MELAAQYVVECFLEGAQLNGGNRNSFLAIRARLKFGY